MVVPVERSEILDFTPESLKNIGDAPVFRLRPATERDMRTYRRLIAEEGLNYSSDEDLHAAIVKAIGELWSAEDAAPMATRYESIIVARNQDIEISDEDRDWASELVETVLRNRKSLRVMAADRTEFQSDAPKVALALYLSGWKRFDMPFKLDGGFVPIDTIYAVEKLLGEIEATAIADKVEEAGPVGMAFLQLCGEAFRLLRLTEDEEKNSPAPSPVSSNQEPSTQTSEAPTVGGASTGEKSTEPKHSTSSKQKTLVTS